MATRVGRPGQFIRHLLVTSGLLALLAVGSFTLVLLLVSPNRAVIGVAAGIGGVIVGTRSRYVRPWVVGLRGEWQVGAALEALPDGWTVIHDVRLSRGNCDHVVVGPGGVFAVETKRHRGPFHVTPDGMFKHGVLDHRIIPKARWTGHWVRRLVRRPVGTVVVMARGVQGRSPRYALVTEPARVVGDVLRWRNVPALLPHQVDEIVARLTSRSEPGLLHFLRRAQRGRCNAPRERRAEGVP